MLKKALLAGVAATVASLGIVGVAYADEASDGPTCTATEQTNQSSDDSGIGGLNGNVDRITGGFIVGQVDKVPAGCPSVGNGNFGDDD